jgi:hypothetical protein
MTAMGQQWPKRPGHSGRGLPKRMGQEVPFSDSWTRSKIPLLDHTSSARTGIAQAFRQAALGDNDRSAAQDFFETLRFEW